MEEEEAPINVPFLDTGSPLTSPQLKKRRRSPSPSSAARGRSPAVSPALPLLSRRGGSASADPKQLISDIRLEISSASEKELSASGELFSRVSKEILHFEMGRVVVMGVQFAGGGSNYRLQKGRRVSAVTLGSFTLSLKKSGVVALEQRVHLLQQLLESKVQKVSFSCGLLLRVVLALVENPMQLRVAALEDPQVAHWMLDPDSEPMHGVFPSNILQRHADLLQELRVTHMDGVFAEQMSMMLVLAKMQHLGMPYDSQILSPHRAQMELKMSELEKTAEGVLGHPILLNSPQQVSAALFDELKLPRSARVDKEALKVLSSMHSLPSIVLQYRKLSKMLSTWILSFARLAIAGRLHPSWSFATATGRLRSSEPNVQALPRASMRVALGDRMVDLDVRSSFSAGEGYTLLCADYSQIELRLLAVLSQDTVLKSYFRSGVDVHSMVAARWKGKTPEKVTPDERSAAKAIVFGVVYGMGLQLLSKKLSVSVSEARAFRKELLDSLPQVRKFIETTVQDARATGMVRTICGRIRRVQFQSDEAASRKAVNSRIQGSAADLLNKAMLRVHEECLANPQLELIASVHDEIILRVPESMLAPAASMLKDAMGQVMKLGIPLVVNVKAGSQWGEDMEIFTF